MKRPVIKIDESMCNGCGLCVPQCHEGAIQILDGKAKLVRDSYCDGLGSCLGHCPEGAITIIEREAEAFDTARAAADSAPPTMTRAKNVVHLRVVGPAAGDCDGGSCPGSRSVSFGHKGAVGAPRETESALSHWPIQLHLLSPQAPQFKGRDLILAADCVPFAYPDFHQRFLAGNALAIACPKLDHDQEIYAEKLTWLVERAGIKSLTVVTMEVPCCMGLVRLAQEAMVLAGRSVPVRSVVIGVRGDIISEAILGGV